MNQYHQNKTQKLGQLLNGREAARILRARIAGFIRTHKEHMQAPGLAVLLVGEDPASKIYVRKKGVQAQEVGMNSMTLKFQEDVSEKELLKEIRRLNQDPNIHGILIQLPLPPHINAQRLLNEVDYRKDVDGLGVINAGRLSLGMKEAIIPCTPLGCWRLLRTISPDLRGKKVLVIGASNLVGKPMAQLLIREQATVLIANIHTENLSSLCREAEIIISATGTSELVRGDWVQEGAIVIDVGINRVESEDGKVRLVGDVAFDEVKDKAAWITPVPGGVGPMTVACLLENTLHAACVQQGWDALLKYYL
ncbi:bifunctional methylenetetrahydrofolate dehydrogenase/methenyltetrahydrofolate cyclohydrolase [Acetobacteraceae bacterium]|nr:bifunctional methylenetetrahydrofolate dehydrogenase/methenyltetrahydrofolate cyclohydrolase [Acetobacteraceae bacterium]